LKRNLADVSKAASSLSHMFVYSCGLTVSWAGHLWLSGLKSDKNRGSEETLISWL
jgi:hypothetical protein